MKITIITLYPDLIKPYLDGSILGRAQKNKLIDINIINLRDFGLGNYKQVDDTPYGGGAGMILRPDVVVPAIEKAKNNPLLPEEGPGVVGAKVIMLSPDGKPYDQKTAQRLSKTEHLILVCGRFEGFDERIKQCCDEVISVGPYVLSGGELPALTIVESIVRLIPGVLGNPASSVDESFTNDMVEYPQYTKPEIYKGKPVPDILKSGNHQDIAAWRRSHKRHI